MEKRGESLIQEFIYFSFRLFLLIVVVVVILAIFNMYMVEEPEVLDQETFIINQRLMRSPTCFAYEKNGRVFPGIIDVDKLENSRIQECMILEEKKGLFKGKRKSSTLGPPRKYYYISNKGLIELDRFMEKKKIIKNKVDIILKGEIE